MLSNQFQIQRRIYFFNNEINIVYGLCLKKLNVNKSDIKYYKLPSQLQDVNFKELIDKVYSSHISDDKNEYIDIEKLICNVSFGMLEKSKIANTYHFYLKHQMKLIITKINL